MTNIEFSEADVASWMLEQVNKRPLYQDEAVWKIKQRFGREFIYDNLNGNPAIDKGVLKKFREISGDNVVWSRSERYWRKRTAQDVEGRMQE